MTEESRGEAIASVLRLRPGQGSASTPLLLKLANLDTFLIVSESPLLPLYDADGNEIT